MKSSLGINRDGHHPIKAAVCGASATLSHDMFMTPFDVIKQRMQLGYYNNILDCIRKVYVTEGIRAFYISFPTTLVMNIPYGCVMVSVNESMKKVINPRGSYSLTTSIISGCIAGAVAAAITNPLDVIKTRLQTMDLKPVDKVELKSISPIPIISTSTSTALTDITYNIRNRTAYQIFQQVIREEGIIGLSRGILPRVCVHAPSVAISWTAYETAKMLLSKYS
jgi:solute carrier family 25 iron transporter 28/37